MLPDEIWLYIFSFLPESDLILVRRVCTDWYVIGHDRSLLYYKGHFPISVGEMILNCCRYNHVLSFDKLIDCIGRMNPCPAIDFHSLWGQCSQLVCCYGYKSLLRKLMTFGPTYNPRRLIRIALAEGHLDIVQMLEDGY